MVADTVIITYAVRVIGADYTAAESEDMTVVKARTGVRVKVDCTYPTPSIPNMVSGRSAANRPIVTEVGRTDKRG